MRKPKYFLKYRGETHNINEWAEITGISAAVIRGRLRAGWDVSDILTPKEKKLKKKKPQKSSKCWYCDKNATNCEWVRIYKPVKGWKAKKSKISGNNCRDLPTYHVYDCPNFKKAVKR